MKIKRNRQSKKGRIEIIPMIDVMFFLLATFMLASLSMQKFEGIAVNLVAGKADKVQVEKQITFTITHDNSIFLGTEQIKLGDVYGKLVSILNDPQKMIIIASDKDASQGVVMEVMLRAKAAGAQHFSIVAKSR
jgi:biopolymer transport protein ExbD